MRLNIDKDSFLASLELGIKSELKHKGVSKDTPLIEYDTESEDVEDLEVAETEEFINEENELDFNMDLDDEDEEEAFDMGLDDEDDDEEFDEEDLGESEEESITEVEEIIQDIDFDTGYFDLDDDDEDTFIEEDEEEDLDTESDVVYFGLDDDDEAEEEDFEGEIDLGEETESDFDMSLDDEDDEEFDMGLDDEDGEESLEESEVAEEVFEEIEEEAEGGDFLAGLDDDEDEEEVDYIDMDSDDDEDYEDADYIDMDSDDEEDYEDADYIDMDSDDGEDEELIPIQTSVEVDTTRKPKNSIYVENPSSENKSKIGVTASKNPIITDNDTLNSNISDSKNIIYSAGMTLIEFLRKNPKARTETDVLKYFTKDALAQELKKGKVLVKRGKLFI